MSRTDFWSGIAFMILSALVFYLSLDMQQVPLGIGPGDYPRAIAVGLFVLGAILAVQGWIKGSPPLNSLYAPGSLRRVLIQVLMTFAYIYLLRYLGFVYLTPVFLAVTMWHFGLRKPVQAILISASVTAAIYVVFRIAFDVPLPRFTLF